AVGMEEVAKAGVGDLDGAAAEELDRDGGLQAAEAGHRAVDADDAFGGALHGREADFAGGEVAERAGLGEVADVAVDGAAADLEREVGASGGGQADAFAFLDEAGALLAADAEVVVVDVEQHLQAGGVGSGHGG